ncbi:MAG: hypothetical protein LBU22_02405 [Dysgonamonadaceae bacterium]|nr:hypothetical protein [Dysgonamonadaceae bacterium]
MKYFTSLPESFCESALLNRFHGFIECWYFPHLYFSKFSCKFALFS